MNEIYGFEEQESKMHARRIANKRQEEGISWSLVVSWRCKDEEFVARWQFTMNFELEDREWSFWYLHYFKTLLSNDSSDLAGLIETIEENDNPQFK